MSHSSIVTYLNPWRLKRAKLQQRLEALRQRDGENCRRCRRPMRFDLPPGHDQAATVQPILSGTTDAFENLCLCHARCNAECADNTVEVQERIRLKEEAAATARAARKPRRKRAA
jgi:hypothetical protein